MAGKGSSPRPFSVNQKTFSDNWDKIFSQRSSKKKEQTTKNQRKNNERY